MFFKIVIVSWENKIIMVIRQLIMNRYLLKVSLFLFDFKISWNNVSFNVFNFNLVGWWITKPNFIADFLWGILKIDYMTK